MDSHVFKLLHRLRAVRFHHVRHGNHAKQGTVSCKIERRFPFPGQLFSPPQEGFCHQPALHKQRSFSAESGFLSKRSLHAPSGKRFEIRCFFRHNPLFLRPLADCPCKRMLTFLLQRRRHLQKRLRRNTVCRADIRHSGLPFGHGSRFI